MRKYIAALHQACRPFAASSGASGSGSDDLPDHGTGLLGFNSESRPDQLRQRVSFALSEIWVVSPPHIFTPACQRQKPTACRKYSQFSFLELKVTADGRGDP